MRKRFDPQLSLGSTPIEQVVIINHARDELPGILKGLQWIFSTAEVNEEIFELLEDRILRDKKPTGRRGMDLWIILVLGVLKSGLDADYSRLSDLANNHGLIRQIMRLSPWGDGEEEFSYQSICDNVNLLDEELLRKINLIVSRHGRELF